MTALDIRVPKHRKRGSRKIISTMSDWDIISQRDIEEEVATISEDSFVIIEDNCKHPLGDHPVAAENESEDCTAERVSEWVETQRETKVKFETVPAAVQEETQSQTPKIQLVSIVITDLSDASDKPTDGLFSFKQHPATWFSYMMRAYTYQSLDIRIMQSVGRIYNRFRTSGILQLIVWANVCEWTSLEATFWQKIQQAASTMMEDQVFLVNLKGDLQLFQEKSVLDEKATKDRDGHISGGEAYCLIDKSFGFEYMSFEDGKAMATSIKRFRMA
ncbi:uncharacterized protein LY89DRAFT_677392 [Mollisia scopiformis]|uniref:Uncharacterized protein n=1 Tax=Mollisia scopiformis TaxID=149040 RepID=A0A132B6P0_MOLSC|nr:uncharacterized protein LY89DRAFT_677392 [Mollisia scopiformis]KUJ08070.1 hypothetical protein LY89DRAFT_677392 [Mollisia scopiformis]